MTHDAETLSAYAADTRLRGAEPPGAFSGSAGGSICGDLVRISLVIDRGLVTSVSFDSEGCAALSACAAAACEAIEGEPALAAALLSVDRIADLAGGLGPQGRHAAELVADALGRALAALASSGESIASSPPGERILVALSGGVDSAVAALEERDRGAEVVAVTLKLWSDERTDGAKACCSPEAVRGARSLAQGLGIPHLTLDLEDSFRREVVQPFVDGYRQGETPNPCVLCNGELRIDAMVALADRVGASHLATGHYARVVVDEGGPLLAAAADEAKDQTYMLAGLRPATLERLRFPLADRTKAQVRERAAAAGLPVARKAESQDLCFLAGEGKRSFLRRAGGLVDRPGDVVDASGTVVGEHAGHHNFTVGQRRGLGVGGGDPLFVLGRDAARNQVVVGSREDLRQDIVRLRDARLVRSAGRINRVRLRYHAKAIPCRVADVPAGSHPELEVELDQAAYGVAPGQTACLLDGEIVVGRATIAA